jgi:hypothetical protein
MKGVPTIVGTLNMNTWRLDNSGDYQVFLSKRYMGSCFLFVQLPWSHMWYLGGFHFERLRIVGGIAILD